MPIKFKNSQFKILKIKSIYYIIPKGTMVTNKNKCFVCGKKRVTTSHHLVPVRAKCNYSFLKQLRIRACKECNKKLHPENKDITRKIQKLILDQKKKIKNQRETIKHLNSMINYYKIGWENESR